MAGRKYWTRDMIREVLSNCAGPPRAQDFKKANREQPHYLTIVREYDEDARIEGINAWQYALRDAGWLAAGGRGRRKKVTTP